jgi:hypothetical protein
MKLSKQMNKTTVILILLFFHQLSFGQMIDKHKAIAIAKENGLQHGIEPPLIEIKDNVWEIKSLLCDDTEKNYQVIKVDATTGEVELAGMYVEVSIIVGGQSKRTNIRNPENLNDIPLKKMDKKPYPLMTPNIGRTCNPDVSPNSQLIAFQYENRKIGIININGQEFENICHDCMYPQWIDNVWVAYLNGNNQIVKKNIKTQKEQVITGRGTFRNYQISPDNKWIAYTSSEVWYAQKKDRLEIPVIIAAVNGQELDLCLLSMDDKIKKYITKVENYVHNPCWSGNGDTLFFNIEHTTYFATHLEKDTINYLRFKELDSVSLADYRKIAKGLFPLNYKCKIYAIDKNSLTPKYLLNEKPGRYGDLLFTHDLKYLIFTIQAYKNSDKELWIQKLD